MICWKEKKKRWRDKNAQKIGNRSKKKKKIYSTKSTHTALKKNMAQSVEPVLLKVPSFFSLVQNTDETISFFSNMMLEIKKKQPGKRFFIDSSEVSNVTVDALIYLIALMRNTLLNIQMKYIFQGNLPSNKAARQIYAESGFLTFVESNFKRLSSNDEKKKIICGNSNDPTQTKAFCEFVMERLGKKRTEIFDIQKIFIELMSNVKLHAYNNDEKMTKHWYIYAEHLTDDLHNFVRIVFVDTGWGITNTIRKSPLESITKRFIESSSDGALLSSVFSGDFRTQTREHHRGNGLSLVKKRVCEGNFSTCTDEIGLFSKYSPYFYPSSQQ